MSIIVGTDLSAASSGALAVARALAAQRSDGEVVLVHVIDEEASPETAREKLDAQVAEAGPGIAVRAELVVGASIDETLLSFADTEGSDLIIIAATSSGSALGTNAEKVITSTRVPVLVLRDAQPWLDFARGTKPLRVLAAVDESIASELALQWLHGLCAKGPVEVVVGAIYYPDDAAEHYGVESKALVDRDPAVEQLLSRDMLRRFGAPATARTRRGLGRIGDHLVELARDEQVAVVVVGTSQKTGIGRLGSVSSIVVHDAPQSVVCVPPNAAIATLVMPTVESVLVATDLSPFANRAVAYAFAIAPSNGEIHLAHVVDEDAEIDEAEVTRTLLALAPSGHTRKLSAYVVRGNEAAVAIAQTAARLGVDMIAIASHGRSGLTRALMGSVADKLLRATRKPVLVLRPG